MIAQALIFRSEEMHRS